MPDQPLRILLSAPGIAAHGADITAALGERPHRFVEPGRGDADIAFVTREVTGRSTKHHILPDTQRFYDALLGAPSLRWTHAHSAGADRAIYVALRAQGVQVTTSSGAASEVVAQTALTGLLALARRFPSLMAAQRERRWAPPHGAEMPRDLSGQRVTLVGWGPIAQHIARWLEMLGLKVSVVRSSATPAEGRPTVAFEDIAQLLPTTDWLVLACPLSDRTQGLVTAAALAALPSHAQLVNVARGEIVEEAALITALDEGRLAGAYLDVYQHEPLGEESPLWTMPQVIATPHSAGFSDGNAARVARTFIDNLRRWVDGKPLANLS